MSAVLQFPSQRCSRPKCLKLTCIASFLTGKSLCVSYLSPSWHSLNATVGGRLRPNPPVALPRNSSHSGKVNT
ncbi:hypothetical protein GGR57DRAFT_454452 [Xylariaceae sp. FL1272]|nr:hypothetical protein GGR57DRAFT_454452 [Xylariaceae sp. FL1272]